VDEILREQEGEEEEERDLENGIPTESTVLNSSRSRSGSGSATRPDYEELAAKLEREEAGMISPALLGDLQEEEEEGEEQPLLGEPTSETGLRRRKRLVEDQTVLEYHLEPPMTRVPGILDAPISLDPLGCSPDKDLQNYTYFHPALIGKLPTFWVPSSPPPRALQKLRADQTKKQKMDLKRFLGRQRIGVRAMEEEEALRRESMGGGEERRRLRLLGRLRNFLDGLTAWAHLSLQ
jgi:hypothetical protein